MEDHITRYLQANPPVLNTDETTVGAAADVCVAGFFRGIADVGRMRSPAKKPWRMRPQQPAPEPRHKRPSRASGTAFAGRATSLAFVVELLAARRVDRWNEHRGLRA